MQPNMLFARYIVLFLLLIIAITGTMSCRALYADGPFWLYQMLINDGLYIFDIHRAYAQYIVEWPVYIALKLGVHDLNTIMRVFSFGIVAIPIAFWYAALMVQFRTAIFWLLALACSVTYLRSGFFAVGEFNTTYGLVALSISIILKKETTNFLNGTLIFSSIVLVYSYESMLFLGIVLFIACLTRLIIEKNDGQLTKLTLVVSGCLFVFASFVGIRSTFFYRDENLQTTINYGAFFQPHILYLIGIIISATLMLFAPIRYIFKVIVAVFSAVITLTYIIYVVRWDDTGISYGFYSYAYRSLGAFMLAAILCIACMTIFIPQVFKRIKLIEINTKLLTYIVAMAFIVQSSILLFHTVGYYRWLKAFEEIAINIKGLVPIDKTKIGAGYGAVSGYNWPWSNSTLSVLLRGNAESIVTNASNFNGWETFDPKMVDKYPLKKYKKTEALFP